MPKVACEQAFIISSLAQAFILCPQESMRPLKATQAGETPSQPLPDLFYIYGGEGVEKGVSLRANNEGLLSGYAKSV